MKLKNRKIQAAKKRTSNFLHSPTAVRLLICSVGLLVLAAIYVLAVVPVRYDLQVGTVPNVTIAATKDVVDEFATNAARDEAEKKVRNIYIAAEDPEEVTAQVNENLKAAFDELWNINDFAQSLSQSTYSKELETARGMLKTLELKDHQLIAVMKASPQDLDEAYNLLLNILSLKMSREVREDELNQLRDDVLEVFGSNIISKENAANLANLQNRVLADVLDKCLLPNTLIDHAETNKARQEVRDKVEPIICKQGQNIVVKGEGVVTQGQLKMLSALGLLSDGEVDSKIYLGAVLLVAAVVVLMLCLMSSNKDFWKDWKKLLILFIAMVLTLALSVAARMVHVHFVPVLLATFLITALFGKETGLKCGAAVAILTAALAAGGNEAYGEVMALVLLTGLVSGTMAVIMLDKKSSRLHLLITGLVCGATNFSLIFTMGLMTEEALSGAVTNGLWSAGASLIASLLTIGILPVLESVFNLATPMKLMELSNPNQSLLRKLMLEAPGTYHHSILVANLAEAAAEAIGANPLLARVGGYYHDIGKLKRPSYFKENQMGEKNAHDDTDPYVSAAIVTAHTIDGVSMGKNYRLPPEVLEIIGNHHGDTPVMYFYHKAVQLAAGDEIVDMDTFRYNGHPPKSAEAAVVLLCDTIEAAVRTLQNPTPEAMEEFIVKLVRGKLEDGQLSDCPLTLRDIDKICAAVTTVLSGVFHERIEYPEVKHSNRRLMHAAPEAEKETAKPEEKTNVPEETKPEKVIDTNQEALTEAAAKPEAEPKPEAVVEPMEYTPDSIIMPEPKAEKAPVVDMNMLMAMDEEESVQLEMPADLPEETDGEA